VAGALEGLRVIDLTLMLAGPYCTMLLADQGADVIKVEPVAGDGTRSMGPYPSEASGKLPFGGYFQSINRGKRSIGIDLKHPEGKAALKRLVQSADVLVENYRAGVMDKLGLGYEVLREVNPRLVYAAIRGFGDPRTGESPYVDWPAYDVVAQAMGGIISITGPKGEPTKVGPGLGDTLPAALTAFGIMSAVYRANRTGEGQFVDVAMYDAMLAFCERIVYLYSYAGTVSGPEGNAHLLLCPFGLFPAKDGLVAVACPLDHFWAELAGAIGRPELATDPRYQTNNARVKRNAEVVALLSDWTQQFTKAELVARLGGKLPFGPVNDVTGIFADAHPRTRGMLVELEQPGIERKVTVAGTPIKMTATPGVVARRSPLLGEHSNAILAEAGYDDAGIAALKAQGAIA
jgi:formyl-CoA transferase